MTTKVGPYVIISDFWASALYHILDQALLPPTSLIVILKAGVCNFTVKRRNQGPTKWRVELGVKLRFYPALKSIPLLPQDLELYIQIYICFTWLLHEDFLQKPQSQHASWSPNLPTSPQSTMVGPGDQAKSSFLIICPQVLSILSAKLYNSLFFPAVAIAPKPRPLHLSWASFFLKLQPSCLQSYLLQPPLTELHELAF